MRTNLCPGASILVIVVAACLNFAAFADELVDYKVIDGKSIPSSLTGQPGDATRGREVVTDTKLGNCLACHQISVLEDQILHGNIGPSLAGVASRMGEGEFRLKLVDPGIVKPGTIMPAFYRNRNFHRVMPKYKDKAILTAAQIENVVAFLLTLTEGDDAPAVGLTGNGENTKLDIVSYKPVEGSRLEQVISGYWFQAARTRAIFDDDFENPGFYAVDAGEALWGKADGAATKSCADCHGEAETGMKGAGARYPVFHKPSGKLLNLEQRINLCRTENQKAEAWNWGSGELVGMTTYVRHQSRGMPVDVSIDGPARSFFEKGKEFFFKRRGQINMSCDQCHDQNVGKWLRGNKLSQAQTSSYPHYGLYFSKMDWTHQIFEHCVEQMRSTPYPYGSDEYVNLELFMAWRGQGLPVETPGVR